MTREEILNKEKEEFMARYNNEMNEIRKKQINCSHKWSEPKYDPEFVTEYDYEMVRQGSDVWPSVCGSHKVKKDRWSRQCCICDKKEYTYEQAPVKYAPKFS